MAILSCLSHTNIPIDFVGRKQALELEGCKWKMALSRYCTIHTSLLIWRSCSIAEQSQVIISSDKFWRARNIPIPGSLQSLRQLILCPQNQSVCTKECYCTVSTEVEFNCQFNLDAECSDVRMGEAQLHTAKCLGLVQ